MALSLSYRLLVTDDSLGFKSTGDCNGRKARLAVFLYCSISEIAEGSLVFFVLEPLPVEFIGVTMRDCG